MGVVLNLFPAALNRPQGVAWLSAQGLLVSDFRENAILLARGLERKAGQLYCSGRAWFA
jgi:hypothetical protein